MGRIEEDRARGDKERWKKELVWMKEGTPEQQREAANIVMALERARDGSDAVRRKDLARIYGVEKGSFNWGIIANFLAKLRR